MAGNLTSELCAWAGALPGGCGGHEGSFGVPASEPGLPAEEQAGAGVVWHPVVPAELGDPCGAEGHELHGHPRRHRLPLASQLGEQGGARDLGHFLVCQRQPRAGHDPGHGPAEGQEALALT